MQYVDCRQTVFAGTETFLDSQHGFIEKGRSFYKRIKTFLAIPVTTGDLLPTEGYLSAVLVYTEGLIHFLLLISAMKKDGGKHI